MSEKVGYGRPPKATRFKKGRSGNPRGRPKGSKNMNALMRKELAQSIEVTEGGRRRRMTKAQAIVKSVTNKAIQGDPRAITKSFELSGQDERSTPDAAMPEPVREDRDILTQFVHRVRAAPSTEDVIAGIFSGDDGG